MLVKVRINAMYGCTQLLDKQIYSQTWVKEVSNNVFFSMFLSESLAEALDANIIFPLSLLISFCSWAALPYLDASTKLEVATLIWLSIAWLGRN